jgi:hypothetical protein
MRLIRSLRGAECESKLNAIRTRAFKSSKSVESICGHSTGEHGRPGATRGHPGHRQALLVPTEIIEVTPEACPCGQRELHAPTPYHTHQVIELPEILMQVTHVVLHEARCSQCGRLLRAPLPEAYRYGYGPRLTALIGELSGSQRGSRSAVQEFCTSVLGCPSAGERFNAWWSGSRKPSPRMTRPLPKRRAM